MNRRNWWFISLAVLGLSLLGIANVAQAQDNGSGVSGNPTTPGKISEVSGTGGEVVFGGPASPTQLYYDPNAGPWQKIIIAPTNPLLITETIHVSFGGQLIPWTDWHEDIMTGNGAWEWLNPTLQFQGSTNQILGTISNNAQTVSWDFDPALSPCTTFTITKTLHWRDMQALPGQVIVNEYPTVPEPGTFVLLAGGLLTLVLGYCWRRR